MHPSIPGCWRATVISAMEGGGGAAHRPRPGGLAPGARSGRRSIAIAPEPRKRRQGRALDSMRTGRLLSRPLMRGGAAW